MNLGSTIPETVFKVQMQQLPAMPFGRSFKAFVDTESQEKEDFRYLVESACGLPTGCEKMKLMKV